MRKRTAGYGLKNPIQLCIREVAKELFEMLVESSAVGEEAQGRAIGFMYADRA